MYTVVFSLQESGLSRWVGGRFSSVHGGVLVAGVGPVAVGGERYSSVHGGVLVAGVGPVAVWGGGAV